MKKFCVWFGLLMSTAVFTACGTGIKNSSVTVIVVIVVIVVVVSKLKMQSWWI